MTNFVSGFRKSHMVV